MGMEIERKFLVLPSWDESLPHRVDSIVQGYLNLDKDRTVRVRTSMVMYGADLVQSAFLTIKGPTKGCSKLEFEYEIPKQEADEMLALCEGSLISKRRHHIQIGAFTWEVDEFLGDNEGLIVAEIELPSEDTIFYRPDWLGREVTHDHGLANSSLATNPYKNWKYA